MNKKSMNEIDHVTTLFIEKHNISNLASDEDSVLMKKLIIELYTNIMSTSEWWVMTEQRNNEDSETTNIILSIIDQFIISSFHHFIISSIHQFIRTIRTIRYGWSKNNPFCDKNLLMLLNVHKSTVNSEICIHPDKMQSRIQLKISHMLW
jgi:hypothetical protein